MSVIAITPKRLQDPRGWFCETWNEERFQAEGIIANFCQDNHSYSAQEGTLRGLHFQRPPHAQAKLIRCVRGRIFDVAVDIRPTSPTFKHWVGLELSAAKGNQLYIPVGYAHGFLTLEAHCEIAYKVDAYYSPQSDAGLAWNDPNFAIEWPLSTQNPHLSEKDAALPFLTGIDLKFEYDGKPLLELTD